MSLIGALNIGKSALATHQAALQVTGNNIANAGNPGYTRQTASVVPGRDQQLRPGIFVGTGVDLSAVQRQIDEALEGRLRGSISAEHGAATMQQWLGRIEAVFNELTDDDLSTQLSHFFNAWSNLANKPTDVNLRQIVLQAGESVARWMQGLRGDLVGLQTDVDARMAGLVRETDELAGQIARLNGQIVQAEGGAAGQANGLRDQRDVLLKRLSEMIDVKTVPGDNGMVNVYVGSEPLVYGTDSRGVAKAPGGFVAFRQDNGRMNVGAGQLFALAEVGSVKLGGLIEQLDAFAGTLIFELNKLHASGQGVEGFTSLTSGNAMLDATVALNDARNGLAFPPATGSFVVHVKDRGTGLISSTLVQVDLNRTGSGTSLLSLMGELDGVDGISASIVNGRLKLEAGAGVELSFSQDSSGVLAAMGINTFFTGSNAHDIGVNAVLRARPGLLAAAGNGQAGDNQMALTIAALETRGLASLDGMTLASRYEGMVNGLAVAADSARRNAESMRHVRETLEAQREALSGVSLDEEAINLMRQQRAFQGAARLVSAVDEMMRTILNMV
jgi:flagellar hook-associated protein 1